MCGGLGFVFTDCLGAALSRVLVFLSISLVFVLCGVGMIYYFLCAARFEWFGVVGVFWVVCWGWL